MAAVAPNVTQFTRNVTLAAALVAPNRMILRGTVITARTDVGQAAAGDGTEGDRREQAMTESGSGEIEVLSGTAAGGLRWVVRCSGDAEDLYTMLRVYSGDEQVVAGSGFGGPALQPGSIMSEWRGRTDDLPYFVMARTAPAVTRLVATTDRGADVVLELSEPVERFGLRFAAAALPSGHAPLSIRAEHAGTVLEQRAQRMPRPFRGHGQRGV